MQNYFGRQSEIKYIIDKIGRVIFMLSYIIFHYIYWHSTCYGYGHSHLSYGTIIWENSLYSVFKPLG